MKKCIICEEEAKYCIKDTFDYYCQDCARDQFGDISVLVAIENHAQALKKVIDEEIEDIEFKGKKAEKPADDFEIEEAVAYTVNKEEE